MPYAKWNPAVIPERRHYREPRNWIDRIEEAKAKATSLAELRRAFQSNLSTGWLTQKEFAHAACISLQHLYRLENWPISRTNPTLKVLRRLATALAMRPGELAERLIQFEAMHNKEAKPTEPNPQQYPILTEDMLNV